MRYSDEQLRKDFKAIMAAQDSPDFDDRLREFIERFHEDEVILKFDGKPNAELLAVIKEYNAKFNDNIVCPVTLNAYTFIKQLRYCIETNTPYVLDLPEGAIE